MSDKPDDIMEKMFLAGVEGVLTAAIGQEVIINGCSSEDAIQILERRHGGADGLSKWIAPQAMNAVLHVIRDSKA